jgi:iron complex transport system substrate-binding protein
MFRKILFWVLPVSILLAACGPAVIVTPQPPTGTEFAQPTLVKTQAAPTPITLTDGLGRKVVLQSPAQRVVSLAPSNTEILFAIGAGAQVVGRDDLSDYPAEVASIQSVGGSMGNFSTEAIVALKPDLVLAAEINPPELVKTIEGLGLTVYYLPNPTTLDGMYANLETVAKLTGHVDETATLIQSFKARVAVVDSKLAGVSQKPTVFYELDATDASKPYTAGPGTFIDQLIQRAGGVNVGSSLKDPYPQVSLEELVVLNPDIILLSDSAYGETPEKVAARAGWGTLAAVKNGRIIPFDYHLLSLPGPRLVDGLEQLAKILHPELFK